LARTGRDAPKTFFRDTSEASIVNEADLAKLFGRLGARDPDSWARSQVQEGIPQLARFLFLRQAWREVVSESDHDWIAAQLGVDPAGPGGGIVPALKRLLSAGDNVSDDLSTVVRVMQWQLLHRLCYLMNDPGDVEKEVRSLAWALFQVDEDGAPIAAIPGLHESVLETEPSGREMRPPDAASGQL
jgi:hypothetical protein